MPATNREVANHTNNDKDLSMLKYCMKYGTPQFFFCF